MEFRNLATSEASELVERLVSAVEAEVATATERTQAAAHVELEAARKELEQATATLAEVRDNEAALQATMDEMYAESKTLQRALGESRQEQQRFEEALEKTGEEVTALRSALEKAQAGDTERQETITSLEAAIASERERCGTAQARVEELTEAKAQADAQYEKARAAWVEETCAMKEETSRVVLEDLNYLRLAFEKIDTASTVSEAMDALVSSLASAFPRVALFHINANRMVSRRPIGLDGDVSDLIVPMTGKSALVATVQSGRVQRLAPADLSSDDRKLFGGDPSVALVLPVVIEGKTTAVIYADDSGQKPKSSDPHRGAVTAEVLLLHATPHLGRLWMQEKLAEYDRQMLAGLKVVHPSHAS